MINSILNFFKSAPTENESDSQKNNDIVIDSSMKEDAKTYIQTILDKANFDAIVAINNDIDNIVYLIIESDSDASRIIGKEGQALLSLQSLTQTMLIQKNKSFIPVFIDCNEYLSLKIEKVQQKAKDLESKLSAEKPKIELFPMSSFERRAIHTFYKDNPTVKTFSVGNGDDRRIVLELKS
jgi:spoIIIJ-associated protein